MYLKHIQVKHKCGYTYKYQLLYSCEVCYKTFLTKCELKEHDTFTHNPHYPCKECQLVFTKKVKFKRHVKSVHKVIQFTCDNCEYEASTKVIVTKHTDTLHVKFFELHYKGRNIIEEELYLVQKRKIFQKRKKIVIQRRMKNWKTRKKKKIKKKTLKIFYMNMLHIISL